MRVFDGLDWSNEFAFSRDRKHLVWLVGFDIGVCQVIDQKLIQRRGSEMRAIGTKPEVVENCRLASHSVKARLYRGLADRNGL